MQWTAPVKPDVYQFDVMMGRTGTHGNCGNLSGNSADERIELGKAAVVRALPEFWTAIAIFTSIQGWRDR